ncbi:MAG: cyclic nucleotide-binding domain-containing protein, partial [SAR324 cluster bacterium]|nr:cyclic nucleotide-binding domain-containing protein [SAR324 cluster bacterium]
MSNNQKKILQKVQKNLQKSFDPERLQAFQNIFSQITDKSIEKQEGINEEDLKSFGLFAQEFTKSLALATEGVKKISPLQKQKIAILQKLPLFQNLIEANLVGMAEAMTEAAALAGDELLSQGEASGQVVFIREGSAEIIVNGELVATRGKGDSIGEMSCLRGEEMASATVRATQNLSLWQIDRDTFLREVNQLPQLWRNVFLEMTDRFQNASRRKAELLQHSLEGVLQLD